MLNPSARQTAQVLNDQSVEVIQGSFPLINAFEVWPFLDLGGRDCFLRVGHVHHAVRPREFSQPLSLLNEALLGLFFAATSNLPEAASFRQPWVDHHFFRGKAVHVWFLQLRGGVRELSPRSENPRSRTTSARPPLEAERLWS